MTKLYWRERDADMRPCAFRYSKNCNESAAYDKVRQVTYVKLFDRKWLSWLNLEDMIPVCYNHMVEDKEYVRRYGFGGPAVYAAKQNVVRPTTGSRTGQHAASIASLAVNEQAAGK